MIRIIDTQKIPTSITEIPAGSSGVHERVLRAYHIVLQVKELLEREVPSSVILELIDEMEKREA